MPDYSKIDDKTVLLEREISVDKVKKAFNGIYSELRKHVSIPGFRRGKVPNNVIRNRVGSDYINKEVQEMLVGEDYAVALAENELNPLSEKFEEITVKEGQPLVYKVKIEVSMDFELPEYTGNEYKVLKADVSDDEVQAEVDKKLEKFLKIEEVTEDREVKTGDLVFIKFVGKIDGEEFEGGASDNYPLEIGSKSFIEGFEDQVIGMKKEDNKVIKLNFPKDYQQKDFAGKEVEFDVTVNTIKEKNKPEFDEELCKSLKIESEEELYKTTREDLEKQKTEQAGRDRENRVIEDLIKKTEITAPPLQVERKVQENVHKFEDNLKYQNMNLESYLGRMNITESKFREFFKPQAENDVKVEILLHRIFEKEGFSIPEEELLEETKKVKQDIKTAEDMQKFFEENPFFKKGLKDVLNFQKTLEFLMKNNKFEEVDELPAEEVIEEVEAEEE